MYDEYYDAKVLEALANGAQCMATLDRAQNFETLVDVAQNLEILVDGA